MRILEFPTPIKLKDTLKIKKLTNEILSLSVALKHIPLNSTQKQAIFHQEILKSSLFSAKIEGNQLTLIQAKQIDLSNPQKKSQLEISNVIKARNKIAAIPKKIKISNILYIHKTIMKNLHKNAGNIRSESSAIFDQYGNIVYLTPNPEEIDVMLISFLKKINNECKNPEDQLVTIAQSHYYFEKIHPFLDGNGRTGRILTHYQLYNTELFADFALPIEEYLNLNKSEYYDLLEKNTTRVSSFVTFFLEAVVWALKKLLEDIKNIEKTTNDQLNNDNNNNNNNNNKETQELLPRRQEILKIIEDHQYSSFDFISRRFASIPKRTLAYDIAQLVKKDFIIKHGKTRGVVYSKQGDKIS
jgi:Fic family protein